jgi:hypothetical protein
MTDFVFKMLSARRKLGLTGHVFPAASKSGHISEPKYPLAIVAEATNIVVSVHDLRRTYSLQPRARTSARWRSRHW